MSLPSLLSIVILTRGAYTASSNNTNVINTTELLPIITTTGYYTKSTTTIAPGELYATINPQYQSLIQDLFLPDDYTLPNNIYQWNVSQIVHYINAADPELLYVMDTAYLVEIFPEYFLEQLPREILVAHKLYYLLPANDTNFCANCTNISRIAHSCVFPFVDTKYDTYFQFVFEDLNASYSCGLLCEYGDVLWGIPPDEQQISDIFLYVCSILFLLMIIIVWINQCMDLQLSDEERCCRRGFLFHAPLCLVCFYTVVAICFLAPLLMGKENVVCAKDLNDNLTVSMQNPGGSAVCTLLGTLFYATILLFGLYTLGFSFVLWKQFYSPLQSLWSRLKTLKICCLCAHCVDFIVVPLTRPCVNCIENGSISMPRMLSSSSAAGSGRLKKHRPLTCGDVFCSMTSFAHYALWGITIVLTATALSHDTIDAFSPLGICTVGGQEESALLWYNIVPYTVVFAATTIFLPFAIYLLCKIAVFSSSKEHKEKMHNLGKRLLWYFICQEICWIFVCEVSWVFWDKRPLILEAAEKRMFCLTYRAATGNVDKCYEGYSLWSGMYIQMALTLPLAGIASIFLSCHSKNKKRWGLICAVINDYLHCRKYTDMRKISERMHADAPEMQSSERREDGNKYMKTNKDVSSTKSSDLQKGNASPVSKPGNVPSNSPDATGDEIQLAEL